MLAASALPQRHRPTSQASQTLLRLARGSEIINDVLLDDTMSRLSTDDLPSTRLPPPASMPLGAMQGTLVPLYGRCVTAHTGTDLRYELSLRVGDRVAVTDVRASGWWYGRALDGVARSGWFPCSAVQFQSETLTLLLATHALVAPAVVEQLAGAGVRDVVSFRANPNAVEAIVAATPPQRAALRGFFCF